MKRYKAGWRVGREPAGNQTKAPGLSAPNGWVTASMAALGMRVGTARAAAAPAHPAGTQSLAHLSPKHISRIAGM